MGYLPKTKRRLWGISQKPTGYLPKTKYDNDGGYGGVPQPNILYIIYKYGGERKVWFSHP
jgi:hypothetical protein